MTAPKALEAMLSALLATVAGLAIGIVACVIWEAACR